MIKLGLTHVPIPTFLRYLEARLVQGKKCAKKLTFSKGPFTNYVYKRRGVGGQKNRLFVNFYTIENVNGGR